jgi:hypothetical protein
MKKSRFTEEQIAFALRAAVTTCSQLGSSGAAEYLDTTGDSGHVPSSWPRSHDQFDA